MNLLNQKNPRVSTLGFLKLYFKPVKVIY